jgi:hypothetical protein
MNTNPGVLMLAWIQSSWARWVLLFSPSTDVNVMHVCCSWLSTRHIGNFDGLMVPSEHYAAVLSYAGGRCLCEYLSDCSR